MAEPDTAQAVPFSSCMQRAQDILARQQREESFLTAACQACETAVQVAQVTLHEYYTSSEMASRGWSQDRLKEEMHSNTEQLYKKPEPSDAWGKQHRTSNPQAVVAQLTCKLDKVPRPSGLTLTRVSAMQAAIEAASVALEEAQLEVQAAVDRTAAAVAVVRAVRLTEAQWYVYYGSAVAPSQALTASELCQHIASGTIQAGQYVYCLDGTGQACQAMLAVHEWKMALAVARQLAAGPVFL